MLAMCIKVTLLRDKAEEGGEAYLVRGRRIQGPVVRGGETETTLCVDVTHGCSLAIWWYLRGHTGRTRSWCSENDISYQGVGGSHLAELAVRCVAAAYAGFSRCICMVSQRACLGGRNLLKLSQVCSDINCMVCTVHWPWKNARVSKI